MFEGNTDGIQIGCAVKHNIVANLKNPPATEHYKITYIFHIKYGARKTYNGGEERLKIE